MSRIDTPRSNTVTRRRSSLLPEPIPGAKQKTASAKPVPFGTGPEFRGLYTRTQLTPTKYESTLSSRKLTEFGTPTFENESRYTNMTHLEEYAIQTANEMDSKIERLKSELHDARQINDRMTIKEKMNKTRTHNNEEPRHRKDKPMFDHSRKSNWMQGVELHRERRARGEFG